MEIINDQYIQYVVDAVDHTLTQQDVNLSGFLALMSSYYHPETAVITQATILFTSLVGAAVKSDTIPQAVERDVFSDEILVLASGLVYADTPSVWANIGSVVRKMLNDLMEP